MIQHEKSLTEKVTEWINSQGYPLEMKVASKLNDANFYIQQSVRYIDSQTLKSRETDVVCTYNDSLGINQIQFAIECKSTKKPWILFTSKNTTYNRLFAYAITSEKARTALVKHLEGLRTSLTWFAKEEQIGYSLAQAFTDGIDTPYEAVVSAVKASLFLRRANQENKFYTSPFFFVFPVVITSSPLFECYLDENGIMNVQEIQEGFLFFDGEFEEHSGTCLRIVSENAVDNFKKEMKKTTEDLMRILQGDIEYELNLLKK